MTTAAAVLMVGGRSSHHRRALEALRESAEVHLVDEVGTARSAIDRMAEVAVEVVLVAARLPDDGAARLCSLIALHYPGARCVVLGSGDDLMSMRAARDAGAHAYVSYSAPSEVLAKAIRSASSVARTARPLASPAGPAVRIGHADDVRLDGLGHRERRILELMAQGLTNRQICDELHLAEKTVKNYISSLFRTLEVSSRAEAVSRMSA
ncbi:response regulator transcription factor [Herbiconiux liangxiaofengii]|uniref:response regulator transcription factor n=1 Tax=Herbiconiux liangxiaofengii TaxID=3342795 RepID=UPI0035B71AB4